MKKEKKKTIYNKFVKRTFDILLSLVAIIILSPILLLLYILNSIFVGFPTIFKQPRPGKNNKVFYIYKFRSMNNKKDKNGILLPDSQRITWWGKIMRKTSLDELPQLFCILFGKMSIIGFRPRLIKDVLFYDKELFDSYAERPGLTGPIQATSRNENSWEEIFEAEKSYNEHITFAKDIKIFFMTFVAVFKKGGESHDETEEDKKSLRDYYYADYLLRIGKINQEQYDYGMALAQEIANGKRPLEFHPELLDKTLFDEMKNHKHAIIIIKNKKEEFLQVFDKKWDSLLFPHIKFSSNKPQLDIENFLISNLSLKKENFKIKYLSNKVHTKFSVTGQKNKTYNHYFYEIIIKNEPGILNENKFTINDISYSWHTTNSLENNERVKETNIDVINIIKNLYKN